MTNVTLENVTKTFGDTVAVDDLSLRIDQGSFFSLLGPSGCGKTTTMRMIAGLERPDTGRIWIGDRLVFDSEQNLNVAPGERGIGLVFQNYALWPHMTVRENILFGLQIRKIAPQEQRRRLDDVSNRLQMYDLEDRYPNELSGGQQQRVALARELITNTPVLLMDEPLSNLDAKLRVDMRWELRRIHEEFGTTIIYVTHDQIEALTLASEMAVLKEGVVQQSASPDTVYQRPANMFVASFIGTGSINAMDGVIEAGQLELPGFSLPIPSTMSAHDGRKPVKVAIRPEEVGFSAVQSESLWSVAVSVKRVLPMGHIALAQVELPNGKEMLTVQFDRRNASIEEGDGAYVLLDEQSLHVFCGESNARLN